MGGMEGEKAEVVEQERSIQFQQRACESLKLNKGIRRRSKARENEDRGAPCLQPQAELRPE